MLIRDQAKEKPLDNEEKNISMIFTTNTNKNKIENQEEEDM